MNILCLAFIAATSSTPPPAHIQQLIESRIQNQWSNHRADVSLDFKESSCSNKGELRYEDNVISMQADTEAWKGRLTFNIEDVLSGKAIDFSTVAPYKEVPMPQKIRKSKLKKWLPWGLALIGLGTSAWLIHDRNQHVKKLQGLKINF